jgi:hypothetical protein
MTFTIEIEQEDDDRWIAEGLELLGALPYGHTLKKRKRRSKRWCAALLPTVSTMPKLPPTC